MNNAQSPGLDLLMQIDTLLSTEQDTILSRERGNTCHIHLYNLDRYWAAFDKSAFQAEQMTNVHELPEIFELQGHPFPLVMHLLDENAVKVMCKNHFPEIRNRKHIQLPCTSIDSPAYNSWYRETVY